jgi:hypothetical protein
MPRRPPKEWFYNVVAELKKVPGVTDPKALAGWLWYHWMKPGTKKAVLKAESGAYDPNIIIKLRKGLKNKPRVLGYSDIKGAGLVRILTREKDYFPEFALYPERGLTGPALKDAGFVEESRGKWVLRTNKFNVFVYS